MLENLRRKFHQNTEIIDEIWKEYEEKVEQLANSLGKRLDVVPNHVNKRVIYLSKSVGNLSRELCRNRKEMVDSMRILFKDLEGIL
jgi:ABC-type Zn uptake system ZnuABC Zn-binding protein ZnuA